MADKIISVVTVTAPDRYAAVAVAQALVSDTLRHQALPSSQSTTTIRWCHRVDQRVAMQFIKCLDCSVEATLQLLKRLVRSSLPIPVHAQQKTVDNRRPRLLVISYESDFCRRRPNRLQAIPAPR